MPISKSRQRKHAAYIKVLGQLGRTIPQASTLEWVKAGVTNLFSRTEAGGVIQYLDERENRARIDAQSALELTEAVLNDLDQNSPVVKKNLRKLDLLKQRMAGLLSEEQIIDYGDLEVESFESSFKSIETDADEITDECIASLDIKKTKAKFAAFLKDEQANIVGCVNSFSLAFNVDNSDFIEAACNFNEEPEFDANDTPRSMEIKTKKYIFEALQNMFRTTLGEVHKRFPHVDVQNFLSRLDAINFSPLDDQSINLIRSRFDSATQELYSVLGTLLQSCLQSMPTATTSDNVARFFREEISADLVAADAPALRRLVTIANGDCGPHTVILSLLFAGIFAKLPRNLVAQILLDWYCMYGNEVRTDTIGNKQLSDKDFQAFLIEYLNVKTEDDILKFSNKYFAKKTNLVDNITPFLTRCARKAAQDYYNAVTAKEHNASLGVLAESSTGINIDESESFTGLTFTDLEHTSKLLWKRYNIPSMIQGYDHHNPKIQVYGDSEFRGMHVPLVWTRQGKPTDDYGHYIFAFDPEETKHIGIQDNSSLVTALQESASEDLNQFMSPAAKAALEDSHLEFKHAMQGSKDFEEEMESERARVKKLKDEQLAEQRRLNKETALNRFFRRRRKPNKLAPKKAVRFTPPPSPLHSLASSRSSSVPPVVAIEEDQSPNEHQINLLGASDAKGFVAVAYNTFKTERNPGRRSEFYIKQSERDAGKHEVFVKANESDEGYSRKICTLSEPKEPKKLATAQFSRWSANGYYNNVEMMLILANKKIKEGNLAPDAIEITIPNLYTRDQAQQFFIAYYKIFGASIDTNKQIRGQDPFKKFLIIQPAPDAQRAFYRLFHEKKAFTDWMFANPDIVKYITGKDDLTEATVNLDGALACFATHLGYQPPGVTTLASNKQSPNGKFFDGYTHKPGGFFKLH